MERGERLNRLNKKEESVMHRFDPIRETKWLL